MNWGHGLRGAAVIIAVLGVIDPVWMRSRPVDEPIAIRVLESPSLPWPAGHTSRRVAALEVAEHLRVRLGTLARVRTIPFDGEGGACPETGVCVVIGDGAPDRAVTEGALVAGAVDVSGPLMQSVAVVDVQAPPRVSLHGSSSLRVLLRNDERRGTSSLEVRDGGVMSGSATLDWASVPGTEAMVDVPWIPLDVGPRRLRVSVSGPDNEPRPVENVATVAVDVAAEPWPIVLLEPEVTWTGTFVRRALESDPRFVLRARALTAPGVSVSRGDLRTLTTEVLDHTRLVVVTAPEALSRGEVDQLERFVRERGGSLVLLLDRRPSGPVLRLMPAVLDERQDPTPQTLGDLRVSEVVTFRVGPGVTVLEALDTRPVIVLSAMGAGRVIVSGALDAWRYRDGDRVQRYWRSLVTEAAMAAPARLEVALSPPVAAPFQIVRLRVSRHAMGTLTEVTAAANLRCGDVREAVRLWPAAQTGVFTGTVSAPASGECDLDVSVTEGGRTVRHGARLLVSPDGQTLRRPRAPLAQAMAAHGAPVVRVGEEDTLVARVRELMPTERAPRETRPMRSPWWLLPFAACLSGEWWLRRRVGLL